jgi:hypothetical protein
VTLLVLCVLGWALSLLVFAKSEPPFILSLSWIALILTSIGNIISSLVNVEVQAASPLASERRRTVRLRMKRNG